MSAEQGATTVQEPTAPSEAKWLRVSVVDHLKDGAPTVNVTVPIALVRWGLKMAGSFSPDLKDTHLDWESIAAMIDAGGRGRIVHVEDEAEHKTVDVWVE